MGTNLMSIAKSGGKFLKLYGDGKMVKTMPTARDYVQDGLIAMWDGIENAGWGVHDPNATAWKNLVSGDTALHIPDGSLWGNTYLHTISDGGGNHPIGGERDSHYLAPKLTEFPFCSFECSFLFNSGSDSAGNKAGSIGINIAQGNFSSFIYGMPWGVKYYIWPGFGGFKDYLYNASGILSKNSLVNLCATCERGGLSKYFINGQLISSTTAPTSAKIDTRYVTRFNSGTWNGNIGIDANYYGMRIYNRPIDQEEVAANYEIDKARFNLPD